jgi:hypothetical protein
LLRFVQIRYGCNRTIRDKKVVGVFVPVLAFFVRHSGLKKLCVGGVPEDWVMV